MDECKPLSHSLLTTLIIKPAPASAAVAAVAATPAAVEKGPINRPISVFRLDEMPIQSCGQSVSVPRGKAGVRLNAHTELRAKRQHSAREAIYRNRPIEGEDVY